MDKWQKNNDVPATAAHDLRRSNREGRERSPDIDEDITGKELDRAALAELRGLEEDNATWVAKHLVMVHRLLEEDPALAFEHALAASRRGGRLSLVREAAAIAAYQAGLYNEALRELRTYRRMSGDNTHLPLMADSERGMGRPEKAINLAAEIDTVRLEAPVRVELALVVAGAHHDMENIDEALRTLEADPGLRKDKAFSFSPRLFETYAAFLQEADRADEATQWEKLAQRARKALANAHQEHPQHNNTRTIKLTDEEVYLVDTTL